LLRLKVEVEAQVEAEEVEGLAEEEVEAEGFDLAAKVQHHLVFLLQLEAVEVVEIWVFLEVGVMLDLGRKGGQILRHCRLNRLHLDLCLVCIKAEPLLWVLQESEEVWHQFNLLGGSREEEEEEKEEDLFEP
jgi:hypothetical protein